MGIFFQPYSEGCCLCGSTDQLSGEHKIKASLLRGVFGASKMTIGREEADGTTFRTAQGPKSKEFHFDAKLCQTCNSERTQSADVEFARFHQRVEELAAAKAQLEDVFQDNRYQIGSQAHLDVCRYFAKLLCCHLGDIKGPRSKVMSDFVGGNSDRNPIKLRVDEDWLYPKMVQATGLDQYAAHGGLTVLGDRKTLQPLRFHSTLTVGSIRYVYSKELCRLERLELRLLFSDFHDWCSQNIRKASLEPISEDERSGLGLD